jgi:hypothetical protein
MTEKVRNIDHKPGRLFRGLVVGAVALVPLSCSDSDTDSRQAQFIFIDQDKEADADIQVYGGVGDSDADKVAVGSYKPGAVVDVDCITEGRAVRTHPELGDDVDIESTEWFGFFVGDEHVYATRAYGEISDSAANALQPCKAD